MPSANTSLYALNRGEISRSALSRVDVERLRLAAEVQENFMPFVIGMTTIRPGLRHMGRILADAPSNIIDFIFSKNDTALLEVVAGVMRVWRNSELVTRDSVATVVTNGDFNSSTGWTLTATAGASATVGGGRLALHAGGYGSSAFCERTVSVAGGDAGKRHGLRIKVARGPVNFSVVPASAITIDNTATVNRPENVTGWEQVISIGPADANRRVVVGVFGTADGYMDFTEVSLNDVQMAKLVTRANGVRRVSLYILTVPTGSTAVLKVTGSTTFGVSGAGVWAVNGLTSDVALSTGDNTGNPRSVVLNTLSGGLAIAYTGSTSMTSTAWTNAIEDFDTTIEGNFGHSGASVASTSGGPLTITAQSTPGLVGDVIIAVSFARDTSVVDNQVLDTGEHSLVTIPSGDFKVKFETSARQACLINSIEVEAGGVMELPTPWVTNDDLDRLDWVQSGDVIYVSCDGVQPRQIERRANNSWSIVLYKVVGGPFVSPPSWAREITMTPTFGPSWTITLTASGSFFRPEHVGALIRLTQEDQTRSEILAGPNQFTKPLRINGVGTADRAFNVARSGTWAGTLTLQRSIDGEDAGFKDIATTFTNNGSTGFDNSSGTINHNNVIAWYRVGFKEAEYTSGAATVSYFDTGGTVKAPGAGSGVARIVEYLSPTQVVVEMQTLFTSTTPTKNWQIGELSDLNGWPSAVTFYDGRLFWFGRDRLWGSISDDYNNFDVEAEGDAAPIVRSIGFGPIARIQWALPLARLVVGREMAESSIRSSSFDEPLTPTQITIKDCSTQGSAPLRAARIDKRGIFVQQSLRKIYELGLNSEQLDYIPRDVTRLNLDIGLAGFKDMHVQRQPDTHVRFVRNDGQCVSLMYEPEEEAEAFWRLVTDGVIERVRVLPGDIEDEVYFVVRRIINGVTVRYLERLARYDQCLGQPEARLADSHIVYSGAATQTIAGLGHLEGKTVVAWGWNTVSPFTVTLPGGDVITVGRDLGTFVVNGGQITGLPVAVTDACVGLPYKARFKSAKLAYAAARGTAINQRKKVDSLGFSAIDTHYQGLRYGPSFDVLTNLPLVEAGKATEADTIWDVRDFPMMENPGEYNTNSRVCFEATAPRPCTLLGVTIGLQTHDHS